MGTVLAFAPFIIFCVINGFVGTTPGLMAAAATSAILLTRACLGRDKSIKVLDVGCLILFGGLAVWTALAHGEWSVVGVRLWVDAGLLAIVLVSMVIGQPFTLQYARERVAPEEWKTPEFIRTNYIITAVWGAAFVVMVSADLVMAYVRSVPIKYGVAATVLAIIGAVRFTGWYPKHRRAKAAEGLLETA